LKTQLVTDRDWAFLEGKPCVVTRFDPLAVVDDGRVKSLSWRTPYAMIQFKCYELGEGAPDTITGGVFHKQDFERLWQTLMDRGVRDDETVVVIWSKRNLPFGTRSLAMFMPRLAVLVFKTDAYRGLLDNDFRPEITGEERFYASMPIERLQPSIWKHHIAPTLHEQCVESYAVRGDERYIDWSKKYG
jgi:hypothetical protein